MMTLTATIQAAEQAPRCVFCSYPLTGLAEGRPCPECGRRSVPEDARAETQAVFDRWLSLSWVNLRFFRPYPYAWWWSLDRPGDARRASNLLALNLALFWGILGGAILVANCCQTRHEHIGEVWDPNDPQQLPHVVRHTGVDEGFLCRTTRMEPRVVEDNPGDWNYRNRYVTTVRFGLPQAGWFLHVLIPGYVVLVYAILHGVGFVTQLTRTMPRWARARTSVVNASYAASGKLVWQAVWILPLIGLEMLFRLQGNPSYGGTPLYRTRVLPVLAAGLVLITVLPWISVLRSDPTRTLVLGRGHAVRIFLMYVIALPFVTWAVVTFGAAMFFRLSLV